MAVTASIVVNFVGGGGTANGHLSAEVDNREDGLNTSQTFFAGDSVYLLVYKTDNVILDKAGCSAGTLAPAGSVVIDRYETITFAGTGSASLEKPSSSGLEYTWVGNSLGYLLLPDPLNVKASVSGVATANVKYKTTALVYRLSSPANINGEISFSIVVYFEGHTS